MHQDRLGYLDQLANRVLGKLVLIEASPERIAEKSNQLPDKDDLIEMVSSLQAAAGCLETVPGLFAKLPGDDELEELERQTGAIATNLSTASIQ
jgi:hypothetical protein